LRLAQEIVSLFHSKEKASGAKEKYVSFAGKGTPTNVKEVEGEGMSLIDFLAGTEGINSKTNARRLIDDGAVEINDALVKEQDKILGSGDIIKVGKHRFFKITS